MAASFIVRFDTGLGDQQAAVALGLNYLPGYPDMRFTFLLPCDNFTGGARVVAVYASELKKLGHEVLVVTCAQDPQSLRERLRAFFRDKKALGPLGHIALSGVPHKIMSRRGPIGSVDVPDADVVVATWWETAVWMHEFPHSKGSKVHMIQGYEVWFGPHFLPQLHAALRLPNLKIAISRGLKETIEAELGPLQVHVVPNAVDLLQFNAPVRMRNQPPRVGFIYSQASIKGTDICAAACALARKSIPDLQVLAFGIEALSPKLPLPEGATYYYRPEQAALREHYAACDYWLFGSRLDSFGLPILEAMACRTPVIGVPIGAAPDLLPQGGGILVENESPQSMANAIVKLCRQPDPSWQSMSDAAHTKAHAYSWTDATEKLLSVIANNS
jgi:glycosyltransferase involved in cell wall biosynthesis